MKKRDVIERYREEIREMDEYELSCRLKGNRVLVASLGVLSMIAIVFKDIFDENILDILFIFSGSVSVFQLYMFIKTKKYWAYLLPGILLLLTALFAFVKYVMMRRVV